MELIARSFINVRATPGTSNKDQWDVTGSLAPGQRITTIEGPIRVDGLEWIRFDRGWVALADGSGERLLTNVEQIAVSLCPPVDSGLPISQYYGENPQVYGALGFKGHTGIDWATPVGSNIYAMAEGRVVRVETDPAGYGLFVKLSHDWGESLYAHLSRAEVAVGDQIAACQVIGQSGSSGWSTGPHLHAQVRVIPFDTADGMNGCSDFLALLA